MSSTKPSHLFGPHLNLKENHDGLPFENCPWEKTSHVIQNHATALPGAGSRLPRTPMVAVLLASPHSSIRNHFCCSRLGFSPRTLRRGFHSPPPLSTGSPSPAPAREHALCRWIPALAFSPHQQIAVSNRATHLLADAKAEGQCLPSCAFCPKKPDKMSLASVLQESPWIHSAHTTWVKDTGLVLNLDHQRNLTECWNHQPPPDAP